MKPSLLDCSTTIKL